MKRALLKSAVVGLLLLQCFPASAADTARVVVVSAPGSVAKGEDVGRALEEDLEPLEVKVDVRAVDPFPAGADEWRSLGRKLARMVPGTLAVFGVDCPDADECSLTAVDDSRGIVLVLPVRSADWEGAKGEPESGDRDEADLPMTPSSIDDSPYGDEAGEDDTGEAEDRGLFAAAVVSAVAAEVLRGRTFDEAALAAKAGEGPGGFETDPGQGGHGSTMSDFGRWEERRLWLEGGYWGDYGGPQGGPNHGPWVGLTVFPVCFLAIALEAGWLGLQDERSDAGDASLHRLPISLHLRLTFPVGASLFEIGAVGRLDVAFAKKDPPGMREEISETLLGVHVGGELSWRFPLPDERFDLMAGAGAAATLMGEGVEIAQAEIIPRSDFRITWRVGFSWGLI